MPCHLSACWNRRRSSQNPRFSLPKFPAYEKGAFRILSSKMFKICGPKCSLCCTIISIWGIIQLAIMGGFFWIRSVSLAEDLGIGEYDPGEFTAHYLARADDAYENQAYKCWVAVAVYAATLLFSACQLFVNTKRSYETPS